MSTSTITELETLLAELGLKTPIPQFPAADVLRKPLDIARCYLADVFSEISESDVENAYHSINGPNNIPMGDLAVVLPKLVHGADANVLAFELMQKFPAESPLFLLPFPEGVHLLIMFRPQTLPRLFLPYINDRKESYGRDAVLGLLDPSSPDSGRKKLVIEFSSPNIASEFQGKHLRSTILGAFICNLYESMGWDVTKLNYLGDWGKPIGLLGVGWEKFGSEELFQADPAGHLLEINHKINDLFVPEQVASKKARDDKKDSAEIESQGLFAERNAFFKRMEEGDEAALAFWKRVRDNGIQNYTRFYNRLNVSFDEYSGESQVSPETMTEVEQILKSKDICEESGGAWIVDLKKHGGRAGVAIIRDRAGSTTYLLRDLAAVLERHKKYAFDSMIYVVASDHNTHFSRLFKILELMDMSDLANKLQHVSFNAASQLSEKVGHGEYTLDGILDKCQSAVEESLQGNPERATLLEVAKGTSDLGVAALLAQELSARRASDHGFDVSRMTSFEPGTGLDLQYWYARVCDSIKILSNGASSSDNDVAALEDEDEANLLRSLVQYPEVTHLAYKTLEPAGVMVYLFNITAQLCSYFEAGRDIPKSADLPLYEATRVVLESGLKLLGIKPLAG
ncbi:arginyl-tRNA synthetase [Lophium mytilinum]|uniref:arginine--tRNA ligase n=1 Tax=Lophium mytilinum TaxID=390894 RepID=A0A6A6QCJ4_9PEZI|nr:arginyl-tRNA synthetase [Lophium mytilinum]